ncbi:MAG: tungstate transport system permease protein [Solirubrobacteraceae bacterium]|jgi:tungstate transport system permease protein|nr:tungstate transport system permease protein [Solirubrobacteraceae bacterium]
MHSLLDGLRQALELVVHGDPDVVATTLRTLRVALEATAIAAVIGLPAGCALGIGRFRGRRALLVLSNGATRVPPVAVGQLLWLLMYPHSRWGGGILGGLGWLYTPNAVILAQTLLALPIVIALTASAVQQVPAQLLDQARAFGASPWRRSALALREARTGVFASIIAAMGVAISAVGAIIIVGTGLGQATLATGAVTRWNSGGQDALSVAYGTVLLGLFLILAAALTWMQQHRTTWIPRPS